jgi:hypothetical protein
VVCVARAGQPAAADRRQGSAKLSRRRQKTPELRASLEDKGVRVIVTPEQLTGAIRSDIELTARLMKSLGLKAG